MQVRQDSRALSPGPQPIIEDFLKGLSQDRHKRDHAVVTRRGLRVFSLEQGHHDRTLQLLRPDIVVPHIVIQGCDRHCSPNTSMLEQLIAYCVGSAGLVVCTESKCTSSHSIGLSSSGMFPLSSCPILGSFSNTCRAKSLSNHQSSVPLSILSPASTTSGITSSLPKLSL